MLKYDTMVEDNTFSKYQSGINSLQQHKTPDQATGRSN